MERAKRSVRIASDIGEIRRTHGSGRVEGARGGGTRRKAYVDGRGGARRGWTAATRAAMSGRGLQKFRGPTPKGGARARGRARSGCVPDASRRAGNRESRGRRRPRRATTCHATCHATCHGTCFDDGLVATAPRAQSAVRGRQAERRPHDARHALDRPPVRLALGPRGSKAWGRASRGETSRPVVEAST